MATTFKFDKGPNAAWSRLFFQAPRDHYVTHPSARFRTEFGPVYFRGRLNGTAKLLIVGQDPSTDELLAQRNLVGASGQRVQGFLRKLGITKSYLMLNTFLFGIKGQMDATMNAAAQEAVIRNYRNQIFDRVASGNPLQAIISFGNGADLAINVWPGRPGAIPWFQLPHPSAPVELTLPAWNASLAAIAAAVTPDMASLVNLSPYGADFAAGDVVDIPREDLPFAIPDWHGTGGGTRSQRVGDAIIRWTSPL